MFNVGQKIIHNEQREGCPSDTVNNETGNIMRTLLEAEMLDAQRFVSQTVGRVHLHQQL